MGQTTTDDAEPSGPIGPVPVLIALTAFIALLALVALLHERSVLRTCLLAFEAVTGEASTAVDLCVGGHWDTTRTDWTKWPGDSAKGAVFIAAMGLLLGFAVVALLAMLGIMPKMRLETNGGQGGASGRLAAAGPAALLIAVAGLLGVLAWQSVPAEAENRALLAAVDAQARAIRRHADLVQEIDNQRATFAAEREDLLEQFARERTENREHNRQLVQAFNGERGTYVNDIIRNRFLLPVGVTYHVACEPRAGGTVGMEWVDDLRVQVEGEPRPRPFSGDTPLKLKDLTADQPVESSLQRDLGRDRFDRLAVLRVALKDEEDMQRQVNVRVQLHAPEIMAYCSSIDREETADDSPVNAFGGPLLERT